MRNLDALQTENFLDFLPAFSRHVCKRKIGKIHVRLVRMITSSDESQKARRLHHTLKRDFVKENVRIKFSFSMTFLRKMMVVFFSF